MILCFPTAGPAKTASLGHSWPGISSSQANTALLLPPFLKNTKHTDKAPGLSDLMWKKPVPEASPPKKRGCFPEILRKYTYIYIFYYIIPFLRLSTNLRNTLAFCRIRSIYAIYTAFFAADENFFGGRQIALVGKGCKKAGCVSAACFGCSL